MRYKAMIIWFKKFWDFNIDDKGNSISKSLFRLGIVCSLTGLIALLLIFIIFIFRNGYVCPLAEIQSDKWGHVGDVIGGMIGTIWALSGVFFFVSALILQKEGLELTREDIILTKQELRETKELSKKQANALEVQNTLNRQVAFENTFFQLVKLHHEIVAKLSINIERNSILGGTENETISNLNSLGDELASCIGEAFGSKLPNLDSIFNSQKEPQPYQNEAEKITNSFGKFYFDVTQQQLSHYFRNIYHIYKFIYSTDLINPENKQFYASLLRAQLSSDELYLILNNCLYDGLGYPNFMFLVREYDILGNFDFDQLREEHRDYFYWKRDNVSNPFKN